MDVRIQYYGMLAEITGQAVEVWSLGENISISSLREILEEKYPELGTKKFKVAVNLQISDDHVAISPGSEIALLPPFAGG